MSSLQIWFSIGGAAIVAGITAAVGFFPDIKGILIAVSGLVSAVVSFIVAGKKQES